MCPPTLNSLFCIPATSSVTSTYENVYFIKMSPLKFKLECIPSSRPNSQSPFTQSGCTKLLTLTDISPLNIRLFLNSKSNMLFSGKLVKINFESPVWGTCSTQADIWSLEPVQGPLLHVFPALSHHFMLTLSCQWRQKMLQNTCSNKQKQIKNPIVWICHSDPSLSWPMFQVEMKTSPPWWR